MIRDGSGKRKGRRNRRHRGWSINRSTIREWRTGVTAFRGMFLTAFMNQGPLLIQWSTAEDPRR